MQDFIPSLNFDDVRRRSIQGLIVLILRGGIGKLISMGSLIVLSRLLTPADFGAFAIVLLPVGALSLVADAGIGSALVQRGGDLSTAEEQVGFTLRVLLAVVLGIIVAAGAGVIGLIYNLDDRVIWTLRVMAIEPMVSALGTVPSVRLNRALRFDLLAWAEISSLVAGQGAAIAAAFNGLGVWSLAAGGLATTLTGTLCVNLFAPWRPVFRLSPGVIRSLLSFGLPYQSQGLLHLMIDKIIPALGGLWLAGAQVGYLSWSRDMARWPRILADYVARVGFPAFSRLQDDPDGLNRLLNGALVLATTTSFPVAAVGMALAPVLVGPIFGAEWHPAVGPLVVFLAQTPLDALATVLLPVIYAANDARRGLRLSTIWTAAIWILSLMLLFLWGDLLAIPFSFVLSALLAVVLIALNLPSGVRIKWWPALWRPLMLAVILGGAAKLGVVLLQ